MGKEYLIILALVAAAIVFYASYGYIFPPQQNISVISNLSFMVSPGSSPVLGDANAPIYIVEFTDYQCPYCKRHAVQTFPLIESNYVESGKVRYYLRDYLLHPNSKAAATAARCAGEQGKYWDMHKVLFERQEEWASLSGDMASAKFGSYANELGLNGAAFIQCYASGKYDSSIVVDQNDAPLYGLSGTPSSVIVLPKTANETYLLDVLSRHEDYASSGYLSLSRDPEGNYVFFVKGAFPYGIFTEVLGS
ncbi:MAG: thioredoxin domain-containing protein [Candidatus Micrarchaeia archaeon]